jgi:hypothetical protein
MVTPTARRTIPTAALCLTEKSPPSSSQASPILTVQDIGHAPPEALVDRHATCRRVQEGAGIVGPVGTKPCHFTSQSVVNLSRHGPANNRNAAQTSILIMSSVVPKSPDRHVVMPMVPPDEGECLFLRYRPKLWHRIHLAISRRHGGALISHMSYPKSITHMRKNLIRHHNSYELWQSHGPQETLG